MPAVLVIDQGTHASRAILFDATGRMLLQSSVPVGLYTAAGGVVEQDVDEIMASLARVLHECTVFVDQHSECTVDAAAIVCQRSTLVLWHAGENKVLHPAISWMDTRCSELLSRYRSYIRAIQRQTGLPLSSHAFALKCRWLLENEPAAVSPETVFLPLISFVHRRLTATLFPRLDYCTASRTLLFDIHHCRWSEDLLNIFSLDKNTLPTSVPVLDDHGILVDGSIPVRAVCGDQQAMLFANGQPVKEKIYINIGTGAFIVRVTGKEQLVCPDLMTSLLPDPSVESNRAYGYMLEGSVNGAGRALEWFRQKEGRCSDEFYTTLSDKSIQDTGGCQFINAVGGLGSPWWCGLRQAGFTVSDACWEDKAMSIVASIVFMLVKNCLCMLGATVSMGRPDAIHVSGKVAEVASLCQGLADLLRMPVMRFDDTEATARGAAWLLMHDRQRWCATAVARVFHPNAAIYASLYKDYLAYIERLEIEVMQHGNGQVNDASL